MARFGLDQSGWTKALKRVRVMLALGILLAISGLSHAQFVTEGLGPDKVPFMRVAISDAATGACWTNLAEARSYAEEKLKNIGFRIRDNAEHVFRISVNSERHGRGGCYGNLSLEIQKYDYSDGLFRISLFAMYDQIFLDPGDANRVVIEGIQDFSNKILQSSLER